MALAVGDKDRPQNAWHLHYGLSEAVLEDLRLRGYTVRDVCPGRHPGQFDARVNVHARRLASIVAEVETRPVSVPRHACLDVRGSDQGDGTEASLQEERRRVMRRCSKANRSGRDKQGRGR